MGNDKRSQGIVRYHDDVYGYMSDTLDSQHFMPVGEEDDDAAVLMLQGAQRGDFGFSFKNSLIVHEPNSLSKHR